MVSKVDQHAEQIISEYLQGKSPLELGSRYGVSSGTIRNVLKRCNVPLRGRNHSARKYTWNDKFLDIINSPEKAYVLGFFYADGCNHQSTNRWLITVTDKEILHKIAAAMDSTMIFDQAEGRVGRFFKGHTVKTAKTQYTLRISSPHLCERMTALGAPPKKTGITRWPDHSQIPRHLTWHFLRGLMDGDGYIITGLAKKNNNPVITVGWCADDHLAKGIVDWLNLVGIHATLRDRGSIHEVVVAGRLQATELLELLYKDSTIHMDRKRAKYDKFLDDVVVWSSTSGLITTA